jgi:phage baseplate assembly protein W
MALDDRLDYLGRDLLVTPFFQGTTWSSVDLEPRPGRGDFDDLGVAQGVDALRQALVLRLLTPRGSLAPLGHGGYGSRVHEVIGRENNRSNRLLLRAIVLETLLQEPRVGSVELLEIVPDTLDPSIVHVHIQVRPVGEDAEVVDPAVALTLEVRL